MWARFTRVSVSATVALYSATSILSAHPKFREQNNGQEFGSLALSYRIGWRYLYPVSPSLTFQPDCIRDSFDSSLPIRGTMMTTHKHRKRTAEKTVRVILSFSKKIRSWHGSTGSPNPI